MIEKRPLTGETHPVAPNHTPGYPPHCPQCDASTPVEVEITDVVVEVGESIVLLVELMDTMALEELFVDVSKVVAEVDEDDLVEVLRITVLVLVDPPPSALTTASYAGW